MAMQTFLAPIRPDKLDDHKRFVRDIAAKSTEHAASRKRLGLEMERAYYQKMPAGNTILVVHIEGAGADSFFQNMAQSDSPYDRWFKEHIADIHGMDLQGALPKLPRMAYLLDTEVPKNEKATAFCTLLPADEVDAWWDFNRQVQARKPELKTSRERAGITRECVFLAETTAMGPCVLTYLEGVNSMAESSLMKSDMPFDRWCVDNLNQLHGMDFRKDVNLLKTDCALDWSLRRGVTMAAAART